MWLRKEQGGCEITHRGSVYRWPEDGDVAEVPGELGIELVRLGGYQVVPSPEPEGEDGPDGEDQGDAGEGEGPETEGEQSGPDGSHEESGNPEPEPEAGPAKPAAPRRRSSKTAPGDKA